MVPVKYRSRNSIIVAIERLLAILIDVIVVSTPINVQKG